MNLISAKGATSHPEIYHQSDCIADCFLHALATILHHWLRRPYEHQCKTQINEALVHHKHSLSRGLVSLQIMLVEYRHAELGTVRIEFRPGCFC